MTKNTDKLPHIEPLSYFLPEFLKKFCVSKSAFYREVHSNRLRIYKRGKRTMIERAEAERWYASLRHGAAMKNDAAMTREIAATAGVARGSGSSHNVPSAF
jgi:hypothetical protein